MKLLVQPDSGVTPLVGAIKRATKSVEMAIFRFDIRELEQALEAAVARGVVVHALIAQTNQGGAKLLRQLEMRTGASASWRPIARWCTTRPGSAAGASGLHVDRRCIRLA